LSTPYCAPATASTPGIKRVKRVSTRKVGDRGSEWDRVHSPHAQECQPKHLERVNPLRPRSPHLGSQSRPERHVEEMAHGTMVREAKEARVQPGLARLRRCPPTGIKEHVSVDMTMGLCATTGAA